MSPDPQDAPLADTVALITGGSRGIGRLLGQALASAGASVGLIARSAGNAWDVLADAWWQTIEVNLGSAFLCSRLVLPGMVASGAGRIINITSNAGVARWPQSSAYAVSKAAMIKLTENVAVEACRSGVGIFSVDPGCSPSGSAQPQPRSRVPPRQAPVKPGGMPGSASNWLLAAAPSRPRSPG